jgi:ferredoxin
MVNESYEKLAEHLDSLPGGFPPSKTGAHIRLLQRLFTPKEAELATLLTLDQEEPRVIAEKAKLPLKETEQMLNEMEKKGLIYSVHKENGVTVFQAIPWVIGIYENQVKNLSDGLLQDMKSYYDTRESRSGSWTINQLRTIPIMESIDTPLKALPYEQVEELVNAHTRFAVAPCICRTEEKKRGRGCDAPIESCLIFGDFADFYVRTGQGRSIDKSEVKEILAKANKANLVLNPTNSKYVSAICCCCGDCCGILNGLKSYPKPAEVVVSSFIASFDPDVCVGCGVCLGRCQMQAISNVEGRTTLNPDRCIGCGLCVSTCSSGALTLMRKPEGAKREIPNTFYDTWYEIAKEQSEKL